MARVVAGDDDAFAHLVARHEGALYNYLLRMVQDEALTADLVQETWLRVFQHANRYDTTRKFTTWLFAIASHCCIDALRVRQRLEQQAQHASHQVPALAQETEDPQEHHLVRETLTTVRAAVQSLPVPQREVFLLRHYHGLSYQEISDVVQCSLGTVKSRMHYAVRHLQRALTAGGVDEKVDDDPHQAE